MADKHHLTDSGHHQITAKTVILASIAGLAIGGPFIGMMGFSFLASLTLLLITSPLLIIFSPLLFGAFCILAFAMTGFAVAAAMAIAGVSSLAWVLRSVGARGTGVLPQLTMFGHPDHVTGKMIESGEAAKEHGKDWAGYLKEKGHNPQENFVNHRG